MFRFINKKSSTESLSTIGMESFFVSYKLSDGSLVKVKIFDTAGQEIYRSLSQNYYKKADCCLLVYDITSEKSFLEIKDYYIQNIKEKCKKNIKVVLLGNKTDLEENRQVSSQEGADLSLENDYTFMETSCLKNTNVADAFETLIENTNIDLQKQNLKNSNIQIVLEENKNEKQKSYCCW